MMSDYKQWWLHSINQYVIQCCCFFCTYKVSCKHAAKKEEKKKLNIEWILRYSPCANEYHGAENDLVINYIIEPNAFQYSLNIDSWTKSFEKKSTIWLKLCLYISECVTDLLRIPYFSTSWWVKLSNCWIYEKCNSAWLWKHHLLAASKYCMRSNGIVNSTAMYSLINWNLFQIMIHILFFFLVSKLHFTNSCYTTTNSMYIFISLVKIIFEWKSLWFVCLIIQWRTWLCGYRCKANNP